MKTIKHDNNINNYSRSKPSSHTRMVFDKQERKQTTRACYFSSSSVSCNIINDLKVKKTMTGAEMMLKWWKEYVKENKTYPLIAEVEAQLKMAVEKEIEEVTEKDFHVHIITSVNKEDVWTYAPWYHRLTMFIKKDGVNIRLEEQEIRTLVESLPRIYKR